MRLRTLRIFLWLAVALAGLGAFFLYQRQAVTVTQIDQAFRPEFTLADAQGQARSSADFRGKYQLIFFGFTNCPDVCPTTLSEVAQVMDDLGSDAEKVQPLFISIDPERDRKLGLAEFTSAFHPSILGLAGDAAATKAAADSFRIFFEREDDAAAPDGYTMSHSPALYLVGPEGDWIRQYTYGTPANEILDDLKARL